MCVKIISAENECEFNPSLPLEMQTYGAKEIHIKYEPFENDKIESFVFQLENMVKTGLPFNAEIKVNTNNTLDGIRLDRKIEQIKQKLEINEIIKNLSYLHESTDRKLKEIQQNCLEIESELAE